MLQIPDWLEKLGLGQYAQHFAENDIDLEILLDRTRISKRSVSPRSDIAANCCARLPN